MSNVLNDPEKPLRADAQRNRDHLLKVAQEYIFQIGPDAPLEEIARKAGVGIGTLYRHFPTRSDLLNAVCEQQKDELTRVAEELFEAKDSAEAFFEWLWQATQKVITFKALKVILSSEFDYPVYKQKLIQAVEKLREKAILENSKLSKVSIELLLQIITSITTAVKASKKPEEEARILFDIFKKGIMAQD